MALLVEHPGYYGAWNWCIAA